MDWELKIIQKPVEEEDKFSISKDRGQKNHNAG
jgi:hypothetical protein